MEAKREGGAWPGGDGRYSVHLIGGGLPFGETTVSCDDLPTAVAVMDAINSVNRPSPSVPAPGPLSVERDGGAPHLLWGEFFLASVNNAQADAIEAQLALPAEAAALGPRPCPEARMAWVVTGAWLRENDPDGERFERQVGGAWRRDHRFGAQTFQLYPIRPVPAPVSPPTEWVPLGKAKGRRLEAGVIDRMVQRSDGTWDAWVVRPEVGSRRCFPAPLDDQGRVEVLRQEEGQ